MMRRLITRSIPDGLKSQPRAFRQNLIRWILSCERPRAGSLAGGFVLRRPVLFPQRRPRPERAGRRGRGVPCHRPQPDGARGRARRRRKRGGDRDVSECDREYRPSDGGVATRETRLAELRIRKQTIEAIMGVAENRQSVAADTRKEFEKLLDRGYLALDKRAAAVDSEFRSRQDFESLKAEKRVIDGEIAILSRTFAQAELALDDLRRLYDNGNMRASIDGIVSRRIADQGAVVRAGDPMMEIYGNQRFVLAYLPTGALYEVKPGDRVRIRAGLRDVRWVRVACRALCSRSSARVPTCVQAGRPRTIDPCRIRSRGSSRCRRCLPRSTCARRIFCRNGRPPF